MFRVSSQTLLVALSLISGTTAQPKADLSVLGEDSWLRLRPAWSLTVNDQCLYEFVFQFEHDDNLPVGEKGFENMCAFKNPATKLPFEAPDGKLWLEPRKFWERFPDYVWATIGFNHLSIDWYPCGHRPKGYSLPHYDFSFFRTTPEFRAQSMTCDLLVDDQVIVPGEEVCAFQQDNVEGMGFYIVPGALVNRNPVVNMPTTFKRPVLGNGPLPHIGLRSWDQDIVPVTPGRWDELILFMSTYAGDLVMWQAKVPYRMISGSEDRFSSKSARYFETTVQTLPDTYAFDWDVKDGVVRFHMVGKSQLCRGDFKRAQNAAGGAPVFPNYDDVFGNENGGNSGGDHGAGGGNSGGGDNGGSNGGNSAASDRSIGLLSLTIALVFLHLGRW